MTDQEFTAIVKARYGKTLATLAHKGKEYARGDRLSNFKKAAAAMSVTPEQACVGFMMKHIISVCDLVKDLERGIVADRDVWQEKIGDSINYLTLLEGLTDERLLS